MEGEAEKGRRRRRCSVCAHDDVAQINAWLIAGQKTTRDIANYAGVTVNSLVNHKLKHLKNVALKVQRKIEQRDSITVDTILQDMGELRVKLRGGLDQAEAEANPGAYLSFAREYRSTLESYFAMSERLAAAQSSSDTVCKIVNVGENPAAELERLPDSWIDLLPNGLKGKLYLVRNV